jgi:pimeloyl-ACP methyl ester carboxylesterase
VKIIADQYYESIQKLNCDKIILVGHSYGCSALLKAYFDHKSEL